MCIQIKCNPQKVQFVIINTKCNVYQTCKQKLEKAEKALNSTYVYLISMVVSLLIIENQLQALALQIKIVWINTFLKITLLYYPYEYLSYIEEVLKIYFVKKLKTSLGLIINRCNDMIFSVHSK